MYYIISSAILPFCADILLRSKWHSIDIFDGKASWPGIAKVFIISVCRGQISASSEFSGTVVLDFSEDWLTMSYGEPGLGPTSPSTFSSPDYWLMSYRTSESIKVAMVYPFSSVEQTPVFSILNNLKYATQSSHCSRICHPCGGRACWSHCS